MIAETLRDRGPTELEPAPRQTLLSCAASRMPSQRRVRAPSRLQRVIHTLRTEGGSRAQEASAIGLGLAVGFSPFVGLHLGMCIGLGWLFGLNRLKLYLAANLVNPLIMPAVLFGEVQLGSWLRRGEAYALSMDAFSSMDPWHFGLDLLVGGMLLSVVGGARRRPADLRRARPPLPRSRLHAAVVHGGRSLSGHVADGVGVRAGQDARRSGLPRRAGLGLAAALGGAGRHRLRPGAAAGPDRGGHRRGARRPLAARRLAAAAGRAAPGRRRAAPAGRRRGPPRPRRRGRDPHRGCP